VECSDGEAYHWAGECEMPTAKARWLPGSSSAAIHRWFGGRLAETCLSNGITRRHSALYQT
jgi:hypothetical protein